MAMLTMDTSSRHTDSTSLPCSYDPSESPVQGRVGHGVHLMAARPAQVQLGWPPDQGRAHTLRQGPHTVRGGLTCGCYTRRGYRRTKPVPPPRTRRLG